jgi:GntP family gluconate:H+ symporter
MAVVVGYGIAADMTFQSIGKAFGLGFVRRLEQTGLLVVAGALVGVLRSAAAAAARRGRRGRAGRARRSAAGGLALLQPARARARSASR